jgi:DnaK suppressor protein
MEGRRAQGFVRLSLDYSETAMGNQKPNSNAAYLDRKRRELNQLRDQLRKTSDAAEAEEADIKREASTGVQEYEDDAQRLDILEKEGNLVARDVKRLARVERALQKITEGTYGLSDASGQPIPDDRLEALPDAINTVAEQEASERIA